MLTFTAKSPEAGWPPFIDWLTEVGLVAKHVYRIDFDADTMTATVYEYAVRDGEHYVIGDDLAREEPRVVAVASPPPTR